MVKLIELTQYNDQPRLVNVYHITDVASHVVSGKTMVFLSNSIDAENYIEAKETLGQIKRLVNGE